MEEIHHTHKKTHRAVLPSPWRKTSSVSIKTKPAGSGETEEPGKLPITSKRIDPAPGTHTITYESEIDRIDITHTAHSREGLLTGSTGRRIPGRKKGIYSMKDVLKL